MKNMILKKASIGLILVYSVNAFSLVDYSDSEPATKANMNMAKISNRESSSSLIWKSDFSLETNYELLKINQEKVGLFNIGTHIQTPFNVYFDARYWQASSNLGSSAGNPKLILGFNWLRIGSPSDMAAFNLYGGGMLSSNSPLGSSRTDKIFGIETTKKFGNVGLGIGFELGMSGAPKKSTEMAIGNTQKIEISGGWMATNDIQFEVSAENFKINKNSEFATALSLQKELSYSTLTSKMNLQIFPAVNFEFGARFPMKRAKSEQDLGQAKLINNHGTYSSSVFSGLNLSI
jgi:hypothetical protein